MQVSATYREECKSCNLDYSQATYGYFRWLTVSLICLRLVLLLVSLKHHRAAKLAIYLHFLQELVLEIGLPLDRGSIATEYLLSRNILAFTMFYFDIVPSVSCALIVTLMQLPAHSLLYGKEIDFQLNVEVATSCLVQFCSLTFCHLIVT